MAFILVVIAAIANACMDRVETTIHFNASVFRDLNPKFFSKVDSAGAKRLPFTNYPINFWHICKSVMICSLLAIPFVHNTLFHPLIDYVIFGLLYNITFELFYSKILRK